MDSICALFLSETGANKATSLSLFHGPLFWRNRYHWMGRARVCSGRNCLCVSETPAGFEESFVHGIRVFAFFVGTLPPVCHRWNEVADFYARLPVDEISDRQPRAFCC